MAKKKKSHSSLAAQGDEKGEGAESVPASPLPKQSRSQGSASPAPPSPSPTTPLSSKSTKAKNQEPSTSALIICRNKHWRYISSFHGPWLQLPPEVLESLAYSNFASPRPQPIDPAVFFDLVKIRRLIDEATTLAVRAANGTTSSSLFNSLNATHGMLGGAGNALGFGLGGSGGGGNAKLSRERRHRMREHASQKLAQAYRLDEIAASVATMQSASALEDVAKLVLQRSEHDCDAKYVHFFHEKIPSRSLAQSTSLEPLNDILNSRPQEGAIYRTRAITRLLKEDFTGSVRDLTDGLGICRLYATQPQDFKKELELATEQRKGKQSLPMGLRCNVKIDEKDQPSSLETQFLFHRGGVYLNIACQHIHEALEALEILRKEQQRSAAASNEEDEPATLSAAGKQAYRRWLEARKIVKTNARRALRDYTTFLSHFDYTPGLAPEVAEELIRKVSMAPHVGKARPAARGRSDNDHDATQSLEDSPGGNGDSELPRIQVYRVSALFSAQTPANLPAYPPESSNALVQKDNTPPKPPMSAFASCQEVVTYHPLLTDALHSVLLCHALAQTSEKEMLRHAHMVARLARVCDGYPIFLAPRSPARADWMEVLQTTENWIKLEQSWDTLCAPAPLPGQVNFAKKEMTEAISREQNTHGLILESLGDDRVHDEAFRSAMRAKEKRADERGGPGSSPNSSSNSNNPQGGTGFKRWAQEDGKEYPMCTERAEMIACWIRVAPVSTGIGRSKGKKNSRTSQQEQQAGDKTVDGGAETLAGNIDKLQVDAE